MAKQRSELPTSGASPGGDGTAPGFDRQPDAPFEISADKLTAEELRELVEFDTGAAPGDQEPGGFDTDAPNGGAGIPEPDLDTGSVSASELTGQQDPAHGQTAAAAPGGSPGRLTSLRILPDRGHSEEAEDFRPTMPAGLEAEFEPNGGAVPNAASPQPANPAPHRQPANADGGAASAPGQSAQPGLHGCHAGDELHPDPSIRKQGSKESPARKVPRSGVMKPVVKGLRFAAVLLLASGFGAAGYLAGNPGIDLAVLTGMTELPETTPFPDRSSASTSMPAALENAAVAAQDDRSVSKSLNSLADLASLPNLPAQVAVSPRSAPNDPDPIVIAFWPADGASRFTEIKSGDVQMWDLFFQTAARPVTRLAAPAAEISAQEAAQGTASVQTAAFSPAIATGNPDHSRAGTAGGFTGIAYMPAKQGKLMEQQAARRSVTESDAASPVSVSGVPSRHSDALNGDRLAAEATAGRSIIDAAALLEFGRRLDAIEARLRAMQKPQDYPKLKFALTLPQNTRLQRPSFKRQNAPVNGGAHSSLAFPSAEAGGASAFSLVAGTLCAECTALRDAEIGDRVPRFGFVTDIVSYAEGGRILVMENGSVYFN